MKRGALRIGNLRLTGAPVLACSVLLAVAVLTVWNQGDLHLLVLLVLAPLLEEAVFRAGLQEAMLRRWSTRPWLANGVTAAAFGLAHASVRDDAAALAVALPALLIGQVYQRTGRLRLCVALHAALNVAWLGWSAAGPTLLGGR